MRVLIVEDEEKLAQNLKKGLKDEGFIAEYCLNGNRALDKILAEHEDLDLVILDVVLPEITGIEICNAIRGYNIKVPILMLTVKNTTDDKILGLNSGADDYLTKPFSFEELLARMRALMRRPSQILKARLEIGPIKLDSTTRRAFYEDKLLDLSLKEFNLLEYFMRHVNQVVSREQLLDNLWDPNFDSFSNVVDVHVKNLRKKINMDDKKTLETVRGLGYILKG